MKTPNKKELQQIALNHSSNIIAPKISLRYIKNVLLNHVHFWLMMLHLHQVIKIKKKSF